jgi:D-serine deaminase-like pyridoxal phosphate-dependent protein
LLETNTSFAPSTATHSDVDGHETATSARAPSTCAALQADAPLVGFVDVMTFPALSTATQNASEGQEMSSMASAGPATCAMVQAEAPPAGLVDVITSPRASTATHSDADGHETACIVLVPGI